MDRRVFLQNLAGGAAVLSIPRVDAQGRPPAVPSYLAAHEALYRKDPHRAAVGWFKEAKFGLFMHYGLYTQLERGAWVMLNEKIPVARYEKLKETFRPDRFDADMIADLTLAAGMKYITMTSKHHEGFCLFRTNQTPYNSYDSPARRDLIGELAAACRRKGLGLFLYYSYGADWHHPYFYPPSAGWKYARPDYATPQPQYLWRKDSDFRRYVDYVHQELRELLTNYGPIAGIWFDPVLGYYARPDLFPTAETYALIASLQPQCLISFKQGANGSEDFAAPERARVGIRNLRSVLPKYRAMAAAVAERAWQKNQGKHLEFCNTLEHRAWAYVKAQDGKHRNAEEVMKMIQSAWKLNANLLLDTGPLPDGSISLQDVRTLHEVGRRLRNPRQPS